MRIYTKTGDAGETGLLGGPRVAKDHPRIEACGHVDELNATLGLARSQSQPVSIDPVLERIQRDLFQLGADLARPGESAASGPRITDRHIAALETDIDCFEAQLAPLRQFILPGGSLLASHLHLARAVCRRAERAVVTLGRTEAVSSDVTRYLNRLSDLLFVLARAANRHAGVADLIWQPSE